MDSPAVSVIMPVYNGADYLQDSMQSVLNQSFSDFEFVIIDDASTDDTWRILQSFRDPRIRLSRNEKNGGLFVNLNRLILLSRAPLVKLWSHDDRMRSDCLEKGVSFFHEHPDLGYFYTDSDYMDDFGREIPHERVDGSPGIFSPLEADRYTLLHGCLSANNANLFFPRRIFDEVGLFKEGYLSGDFEMLVRIQGHHRIGRIPEKLVTVRSHRKQLSRSSSSIEWAFSNELGIYATLRGRLVSGGIMSEAEARAICETTYALNVFHGAIRLALKGRLASAFRVFRLLSGFAPLHRYFVIWMSRLIERLRLRIRRKAAGSA